MFKKQFINLHNHTDYSLLDGVQTCQEMVERAVELSQPAIGITDHGTMRGIYEFNNVCSKLNVKPIYGIEVYMCQDRHRKGLTDKEKYEITKDISKKTEQKKAIKEEENRLGIRKRTHACLFAKNNDGLKNLFKLSSIGWTEGLYYRPRIDLEALSQYSDNIIFSTACTSGVLARPFLDGDIETVFETVLYLKDLFGEDLFLEIMPHEFENQIKANEAMAAIARKLDIPLLATNDAHYTLQEHYLRHEVFLCMQTKDIWSNPDRWKFSCRGFYLKDYAEMYDEFVRNNPGLGLCDIEEALENTNRVAELCGASIHVDYHKCLLPNVEINPEHKDEFNQWAKEMYPEIYNE